MTGPGHDWSRLENSDSYFAALTVLVDCQQIPGQVLDGIGLNQNVSQRLSADQVMDPINCENVDALTGCLQLFHQLVQGRNWKFLKRSVT